MVPGHRSRTSVRAGDSGLTPTLRKVTSLGHQVWSEVDVHAVLLIPLGSTEQHGPHLPLDTDTQIAHALAARAAAETGATLAPALPFGSSGEHGDFAGTLSMGTAALRHVIVELVRSASLTWSRIILVNGHGGNHPALTSAVEQMVDEGHDVSAWWPSVRDGDAHAGRTETSLMLAIAPETVRLDQAEAGNTAALVELLPQMQTGGVKAVSENGVLGDPGGASAREGEELLRELVASLVDVVGQRRPAG